MDTYNEDFFCHKILLHFVNRVREEQNPFWKRCLHSTQVTQSEPLLALDKHSWICRTEMAITTRIGRRTFLSLLLILATAITTQNVEAKVFTSSNVLPPSDLSVVERTLQQEVAEQQSGKENSANDAGYIPFEKGTRVRFEDQDGTKWVARFIYHQSCCYSM